MKRGSSVLIGAAVVIGFFISVEAVSRIAYSLYSREPNYLTYGFNSIFYKPYGRTADSGKKRVFRVACFGGSTMVGWPRLDGLDLPTRLQEYLQKKFPDIEIVVENFGIASATPVEAAYILRAAIDMDLKPCIYGGLDKTKIDRLCEPDRHTMIPDLVFLYSHVNATFIENLRLKRILSEKEYGEIKYITPRVALKEKSAIVMAMFKVNHFLKTRSFFYYGLSRIIFWLQHDRYIFPREKIGEGNDIFLDVLRIQSKVSRYQRYVKTANFEETLNMAAYTAKRLNIPIIMGTEPIAAQKYNDTVNEEFAVIHEINANVIRTICQENKIRCFDALRLFKETPGSDKFFTTDLIHLTLEGDRFLGEVLADFISEAGYVKAGDGAGFVKSKG